jgi:hypothetical protein
MGIMRHDAVIVVVPGSVARRERRGDAMPDVDAFRDSLPAEWRQLVVGPVQSMVNDYVTYAFLPDGSKEGWGESDDGDNYRAAFKGLFAHISEDGSSPFDGVHVRWGGDGPDENGHDLDAMTCFPATETEIED